MPKPDYKNYRQNHNTDETDLNVPKNMTMYYLALKLTIVLVYPIAGVQMKVSQVPKVA